MKNFIGIAELLFILLVITLFLLVPVPLVDLAGFEGEALSELLHELSAPVGVLRVLRLQLLDLALVLALVLLIIQKVVDAGLHFVAATKLVLLAICLVVLSKPFLGEEKLFGALLRGLHWEKGLVNEVQVFDHLHHLRVLLDHLDQVFVAWGHQALSALSSGHVTTRVLMG